MKRLLAALLLAVSAIMVAGITTASPVTARPCRHHHCPSPSPTPTTPTPTPTPTPTGPVCVQTASDGDQCGPYDYPLITNSNGYNTYVGSNCWAHPSCGYVTTVTSPGSWDTVATEPAGNTAVMSYPDVQQLFNDYDGNGTWNQGPSETDTPISALTQLDSSYTEQMPHNGGTIAQFAWDIWLSGDSGYPNEVMVWVDNVNRGDGGAAFKATASLGGNDWTLYQYGSGEAIWSLGQGSFAQQPSGTVDLLALLNWMRSNGYAAPGAAIGQIDAGWEICSTGGSAETFAVTSYSLTAAA